MENTRVLLAGILLILAIGINFTFCQKDINRTKKQCIPNKKFSKLTESDLQMIVEDNHLVIDAYRLNVFPNISYWMWFTPPRRMENAKKSFIAFPVWIKKYGQQPLPTYTLEFEAQDCDWLISMFDMPINCTCTLPSNWKYFFRMRVNVTYALPYQIYGTYNFVVAIFQDDKHETLQYIGPAFEWDDKLDLLNTSRRLQEEAIVEYGHSSPVKSKQCKSFNYTATPFRNLHLSDSADELFNFEQLDREPFVMYNEYREDLTHVFFVFSTRACENASELWLFEKDESCATTIKLEKHDLVPGGVVARLPGLEEYDTCNCTYPEEYEKRFWRMGLYLATHNYLCRGEFGFIYNETILLGNLGVDMVWYKPEEDADFYYDYDSFELLHKSNSEPLPPPIYDDDEPTATLNASTSATPEPNKWHAAVFIFPSLIIFQVS